MGNSRVVGILLLMLFAAVLSLGQSTDLGNIKKCSTEVVNGNCVIVVDRRYPLTLPTFQMRTGRRIMVIVVNPLPFETLSLDLQSAQALVGTDQTAGLLTASSSEQKALALESGMSFMAVAGISPVESHKTVGEVVDDLNKLSDEMKSAQDFFANTRALGENSRKIYLQLQEVVAPLPQPVEPAAAGQPEEPRRSAAIAGTPNPWDEYPAWRTCLLHELVGSRAPAKCLQIDNLLQAASTIQAETKPDASDSSKSQIATQILKELDGFDDLSSQASSAIAQFSPQEQADCTQSFSGKACADVLATLVQQKQTLVSSLTSKIGAINVATGGLIKDLQNYVANIYQAEEPTQGTCIQVGGGSVGCRNFGMIYDPITPLLTGNGATDKANREVALRNAGTAKRLGRQVVFSVNAVNQITTSVASVPSSQQKKSIATITVLYADPIFEVSAGAFFSFQPNRSFANQTLVTQISGAPVSGDVVITETKTLPTVEPFAAANWRLGHDFEWLGHRRGAFYFTTAVGLNPVTTTTDFAIGPSISWRALMFSPLYQIGRDIHLTQGEFVGEVWCNASGPSGSIPKCSGNPPSPTTAKYWRGAFALGISIRVASVFSSGSH